MGARNGGAGDPFERISVGDFGDLTGGVANRCGAKRVARGFGCPRSRHGYVALVDPGGPARLSERSDALETQEAQARCSPRAAMVVTASVGADGPEFSVFDEKLRRQDKR